ncbi:MAG: SDR family NAD(P)-dependent oxidoreductase [Desulfitobacteriaceae bacterium]
MDFSGKVCIVTGAAHGFGRAICLELAIRGARVYGWDVIANELEETRVLGQQVADKGGQVHVRVVDLTLEEQIQTATQEVFQREGRIDVLVNNAGGVVGQVHKPIEEVTEGEWEAIYAINLKAVFYTIKAAAPIMKKQRYGRVVNVSSGAGRSFSLTGIQAYASSKAGQIGLTRQMARELGAFGITVNNVAPGFVRSNSSTEKQWNAMGEGKQEALLEGIALHRLGTPEEIAYPVLFFASDYASYVSGQIISADGGHQMF